MKKLKYKNGLIHGSLLLGTKEKEKKIRSQRVGLISIETQTE